MVRAVVLMLSLSGVQAPAGPLRSVSAAWPARDRVRPISSSPPSRRPTRWRGGRGCTRRSIPARGGYAPGRRDEHSDRQRRGCKRCTNVRRQHRGGDGARPGRCKSSVQMANNLSEEAGPSWRGHRWRRRRHSCSGWCHRAVAGAAAARYHAAYALEYEGEGLTYAGMCPVRHREPPAASSPGDASAPHRLCGTCVTALKHSEALARAGIPPGEEMTIAEAAASAGVSRTTLARATATGRLRTIRVGRVRYTTARWVAMWHAAWRDDGD